MKQTKTRWADDTRDRRSFRFDLVKSILRCDSVRRLDHSRKKWLLQRLSHAWQIAESPPDTTRIRALQKVASDARRLRAALRSLDTKDTETLDFNFMFGQTIPLPSRLEMLKETESAATKLAKAIKGQQKEIGDLELGFASGWLINLLGMMDIPCSTRNDHDQRIGNRKQHQELPEIDDKATTAMRCVMLALLDANTPNLGWSMTASIIRRGLQWQEGESNAFHRWRLKDPIGNAMMLTEHQGFIQTPLDLSSFP